MNTARKWSPTIRAASGLFAVLPLPNVSDQRLKDPDYAFDTLKADGVGLMSSYGDKWHGDAAFADVFRELNRRKTIVYTHAQVADCCQTLVTGISDITVEYNTDTARTIISMIDSGRALETPDTKYIWSHAGGTILALRRAASWASRRRARILAKQADPKSRAGPVAAFLLRHGGLDAIHPD